MADTINAYVFLIFMFLFTVLITYYHVRRYQVKICEELILKEDYDIDKCDLIYHDIKHNIKIYDTLTENTFVVYVAFNSPYSNTRTLKAAFNTNIKYIKNYRISEAENVEMVFGNVFLIETKE